MVGLDKKAIDTGDVVGDGVVDVAEVGQDTDGDGVAANGEADRIGRIVGNGKCGDFERFQTEGAAGGEEVPLGGGIAVVLGTDFVRRKACGVNRATEGAE